MPKGFRKGIKGDVNGTRSIDDMIFHVLDTKADFAVDSLEHAQTVGFSVPSVQCQYLPVFTIK